ncbi:MAG: hypothetical protein IKH04_13020, partial [Kiritimatiellae bacterium]|nr:hypothetical protein [Kiritimatiellia bacterium]
SHTAGPLAFSLDGGAESRRFGNAATVWVSSLDGQPIGSSRHLLLTHLTDVQNTGIEYADEALTILLGWGKTPHLMRNGEARVELALAAGGDSRAPKVFRLSSSGRRAAEIPASFDSATGRLSFAARTDYDPSSATYLYEIVRE